METLDITKTAKAIRRYSLGIYGDAAILPNKPWSIDNLAIWTLLYAKQYKVELGLMLAQATVESHFGVDPNAMRSRRTKNIFNIGNVDSGADESQRTWEKGIERYAKLLHEEYLWPNEGDTVTMQMMLDHDFTRPRGGRYASAPGYTKTVLSVYKKINLQLT